jgi:hypothetical protein
MMHSVRYDFGAETGPLRPRPLGRFALKGLEGDFHAIYIRVESMSH